MNNTTVNKIKGILYMLICTIFWGSSFAVMKGAIETFPPFFLISIRMILASIFVFIIYIKDLKYLSIQNVFCGGILGIFFAIGMIFQTIGIKLTTAGRSAFLTASYCILMPFLEWLFLKNKPTIASLIASFLGMLGIGFVALNENFTVAFGDIWTLVGSIGFALEIIFASIFVKEQHIGFLNVFLLLIGGIFSLIISFFVEDFPKTFDISIIGKILYMTICCSALPLIFQGKAQKLISPGLVTIILGFEAVFATIFSIILCGETFTLKCIIGFILIFLAILVSDIKIKK